MAAPALAEGGPASLEGRFPRQEGRAAPFRLSLRHGRDEGCRSRSPLAGEHRSEARTVATHPAAAIDNSPPRAQIDGRAPDVGMAGVPGQLTVGLGPQPERR